MRIVEGKDILGSAAILGKVIILTVNITGSVSTIRAFFPPFFGSLVMVSICLTYTTCSAVL